MGSGELTAKEIAEQGLILKGVVGSTVHGLALEGSDDTDYMGVCIEPPEYIVGMKHFEQYVYRTQPEGSRSSVGDIDLVIYSLHKYVRLVASGNPTMMLLLYSPESSLVHMTQIGRDLRSIDWVFASKRAGQAFLGYLRSQRQRLAGERGGKHGKPRPDFVEKYGYDVKYAMHMLRLGYQGIEFLRYGKLQLPMEEKIREYLMSVRTGQESFQSVLTRAGELEKELLTCLDTSPLPETPAYDYLNAWLVQWYLVVWAGRRGGMSWASLL